MAWPKSPLTAYIAFSVPVIKAADLNAFQDWINAFTNETVTVTGVAIDGVGGAAATPVDSAIQWTNTGPGAGNPSHTVSLLNQLRALNVPKAWVVLHSVGPTVEGAAVFSASVSYAGTPKISTVTFVLADHMDSTLFMVGNPLVLTVAGGVQVPWATLTRPATNQIVMTFNDDGAGGDGIDLTSINVEISFPVFGRQTT